MEPEEVYKKYVGKEREVWYDESKRLPPPTLTELAWLSILFRIVIVCVYPASLVIYRSRLLNLHAFIMIKKDRESGRNGEHSKAYNRRRQLLHIFFCCFPERKLNYI